MDASRDSWLRRPFLVGVVLVALVALVVLAAHGHVTSGGSDSSALSGGIVDTLISALLALYLLGAVVLFGALVWARSPGVKRQMRGGQRRRAVHGVVLALILLALAIFGGDRLRNRFSSLRHASTQTSPAATNQSRSHAAKKHHTPRFRYAPFLAVLGGVGAAAMIMYLSTWRTRRPPDEPIQAALAGELADALRDLRAEPDPRRAVIGAYARMEGMLGESGLPRRESEAPLEYMSRVLLSLGGGARSVRALTRLFERARFSPHAIDAAMKEEAIDAVEALQADLEASEAEVAA